MRVDVMIIKNRNGEFAVNAAQYNYLVRTFEFNEINYEIVSKTNFINSSWEYEKADKIFKNSYDTPTPPAPGKN